MNSKLQKKILKKYPEFFQHLGQKKIYTGENRLQEATELSMQDELIVPMQFGFDVGDGWYMLLEELLSSIQWHIQNENRDRKTKIKYKFLRNLVFYLRYKTNYKAKFLKKLGEFIENLSPKGINPVYFQLDQVKEKFGGLRFYFSGGDDYIEGLVHLAECLSYKICEDCGTTHNVGTTKGWITTLCQDCYEKGKIKNGWELNKQK